VVLVLTGGSALAVPYAKEKVPAILMSWYSGEEGGLAVADVLFGKANPGGRLPLTFYASEKDLPDFRDYGMKNRTYRYFTGQPLWAFGHGRSYSTFRYSGIGLSAAPLGAGQTGAVTVQVRNTSKRDGDEVVQVYVTDQKASVPVPLRTLVAWKRVSLKAGESKTLTFPLTPRALSIVDEEGRRIVEPGRFTIAVGGGQPGKGNRYASPAEGQTVELEVTGQVFALK
jgi:beta-glucosidase